MINIVSNVKWRLDGMPSWKRSTCNVIDRVRDELSNVSRTLTAKCKPASASKIDGAAAATAKSVPDFFHLYEPVLTDIDVPIENAVYFRAVDRATAEDILRDRVDGSCLVRPYKQKDDSVKYIVSIYAKENFFHLFIRKTAATGQYAIGQEKSDEKLFNKVADIINYYRLNRLLCTNKIVSIRFFLVPIG